MTDTPKMRAVSVRKIVEDGCTKYMPHGQQQPDTQRTLKKAGLLKVRRKKNGDEHITISDPYNLRVVCYMLGLNQFAREHGEPEPFPGFAAELDIVLIDGEPKGEA
jgi:hypothetical protein